MSPEEIDELKTLIKENNKLITENNKLIHRLNRFAFTGVIMRVIWYAALIGLPFILYFYILAPYFELFGSNYDMFKAGINELPGLKGLELFLETQK